MFRLCDESRARLASLTGEYMQKAILLPDRQRGRALISAFVAGPGGFRNAAEFITVLHRASSSCSSTVGRLIEDSTALPVVQRAMMIFVECFHNMTGDTLAAAVVDTGARLSSSCASHSEAMHALMEILDAAIVYFAVTGRMRHVSTSDCEVIASVLRAACEGHILSKASLVGEYANQYVPELIKRHDIMASHNCKGLPRLPSHASFGVCAGRESLDAIVEQMQEVVGMAQVVDE